MENAVAWSGTQEGFSSPRYDCFAYGRHHAVKSLIHPSSWHSAIIVGHDLFVPAIIKQILLFYVYLRVITDELSISCTDTHPTFLTAYAESAIPKCLLLSELYEQCNFRLITRLPFLPVITLQYGCNPHSKMVCLSVDSPPNIPFLQNFVLNCVSHTIK